MSDFNRMQFSQAVNDFREARRKAAMQAVISLFTGNSMDLLSFDEVDKSVHLSNHRHQFLDEIPLDAIIGSVGRYEDFNRKFLPRFDQDESRWVHVKIAFENKGLPPIEVYKVDDVYFVLDGNHRVSIARQFEASHIEAYVTEFRSEVKISPEDDLDAILLKAEYVEFLNETQLDEIYPDVNFQVTVPGRYHKIFEHISVHRYYLGLEHEREILWEEAVASWAEQVYLPLVNIFRRHGVLRDFPGRTETDLYLWLKKHHATLSLELGWEIEEEKAVLNFVRRFGNRPGRILSRLRKSVGDIFFPEALKSGPPVGEWRNENLIPRKENKLFSSILVPVGHSENSWSALAQALPVAKREGAIIRGLYIVRSEKEIDDVIVQEIKEGFERRCSEADVAGEFVIDFGEPHKRIIARAAWNDLVMVHLSHPPAPNPIARLRSGFRALIQHCPTPIVAVPSAHQDIKKVLLAYDGSPKSEEALYLSAYLATVWNISLVVLGSTRGEAAQRRTEQRIRGYLESQYIQAVYVSRLGTPAEEIISVAQDYDVDMIVMGGYEKKPLINILFGSVVDEILRGFSNPILVCR